MGHPTNEEINALVEAERERSARERSKEALFEMEGDLLTIRDLGNTVLFMAEANTGMEDHFVSALGRLGYLIAEYAVSAERKREAAKS
jgi:hypothetical protein